MNDDANAERTDIERDANERMRELGRRSGEARRRKREQREQLEPVGDREKAKAALRRALAGGNHAAMVAAAKAPIEHDLTPQAGPMPVEDARAQLNARLDQIAEHRARAIAEGMAELCPTCGAYMPAEDMVSTTRAAGGTASTPGGKRGTGDDGHPCGAPRGEA